MCTNVSSWALTPHILTNSLFLCNYQKLYALLYNKYCHRSWITHIFIMFQLKLTKNLAAEKAICHLGNTVGVDSGWFTYLVPNTDNEKAGAGFTMRKRGPGLSMRRRWPDLQWKGGGRDLQWDGGEFTMRWRDLQWEGGSWNYNMKAWGPDLQ